MAEADERIDPTDLESIDALLDEVDLSEEGVANTDDSNEPFADTEGLDDFPSRADDYEDSPGFRERQNQEFASNDELTVEEMEALKKLIIIFGAVITFLVVIGVGMASWAALKSSVDPDGARMFEELFGESELARTTAQANAEAIRDLDRKMDALSFQLDGMVADFYASNSSKENTENQAGDNSLQPDLVVTKEVVTKEVAKPALVESPALEAKVDGIARSLDLAQRRVVEINNRVKSLQQQYTTLSASVKQVEKSVLENALVGAKETKVETEESEAPETKSEQAKPYQYRAPNTFNYDAVHEGTSYP